MSEKVSRFAGKTGAALPSWVGIRPRGETGAGPQTIPGRLAETEAKSLQDQINALQAERAAGMVVVRFDPKRVRATEFINRDERAFADSEQDFTDLKESLRKNGQEQPARVRPVEGDSAVDAEVVSGHRRHRAALALDAEIEGGFPFYAVIDAKAAETKDFVLKMYRENEQRVDLSPFEKGCMFAQWLESAVYDSQREIATAVDLSEGTVAKYLAVSSLPKIVRAAFGDARTISLRWAASLSQAIKDNDAAVLKAAEKIAQKDPRPDPDAVFKALLAAAAGKRPTRGKSRDESIFIGGRIPLKVGLAPDRIHLKFTNVSSTLQKEMRKDLQDWAEEWLKSRLESP